MTELGLYQGGYGVSKRDSREAAKEIARGNSAAQVQAARIDNETDATIAKNESNTAVTAHAMMGVTRIAQLQGQLELQCPSASGRLSMLADEHAYGMAETAMEHRRRTRRL